MSDGAVHTTRGRTPGETVLIVLVCVLILAAIWYVMAQRQQVLRASPAGFDGLQVWLSSEGVDARNFSGGWPIDEASVGLLVIPLYDTALDRARVPPETKEELLLQQDEYDLTTRLIVEKARRVPVLVVLPKWRSGMRLTGLGHPVLLVEPGGPETILRALTGDDEAELRLARRPFTSFSYPTDGRSLDAQIYAAQMIAAKGCAPVIGRAGEMLLADCPLAGGGGDRVLILSDPDLLNNHGLRLGENAFIARDLMAGLADEGSVLIDYSRENWLTTPDAGIERERTWADLRRFFGPPFRVLWLGAAALLALALWRASIRYGPAIAARLGPGASKSLAVAARARLMRLSDQDGALLGEYARARIGAVASRLFGPAHARHYAGEDAFLGYVERRHPRRAADLAAVLAAIHALPARTTAGEAIRHVDDLERILEQITDDT